jgi:hypothetical protein
MKSQFEYTLKDPINVAIDGEQIECFDIIVKCPRPKDRMNCMFLENNIKKAIHRVPGVGSGGGSDDDQNQETMISGIKEVISAYSEEKELSSTVNLLRELFCEGNRENPRATIGGEKFTRPLFDEIHYMDLKELIARYVVNFLSLGAG